VKLYLLCSALLVILYFLLAFNVSMMRGKTRIGVGTNSEPSSPLNKAIRAHGNAAEYLPLFVAIFLYFSLVGADRWVSWVAVTVTVCRFAHAVGMYMSKDLNRAQPLRFIGALGTYVGGIALGVALLLRCC
jgi:uncharacterized membrane protein YecN with MAPEG domain